MKEDRRCRKIAGSQSLRWLKSSKYMRKRSGVGSAKEDLRAITFRAVPDIGFGNPLSLRSWMLRSSKQNAPPR
jgi:hypothetical protein